MISINFCMLCFFIFILTLYRHLLLYICIHCIMYHYILPHPYVNLVNYLLTFLLNCVLTSCILIVIFVMLLNYVLTFCLELVFCGRIIVSFIFILHVKFVFCVFVSWFVLSNSNVLMHPYVTNVIIFSPKLVLLFCLISFRCVN